MKWIVIVLFAFAPAIASAGLITFNLRDPAVELLDEVSSFDYTVGGVTATLTADPATYTDTSGGSHDLLLNQTASAFGVNVDGLANSGGCTNEQSSQLDGGCTPESIIVELDVNAILVSIAVSSFGSSDLGSVSFQEAGLLPESITHTGVTNIDQPVGSAGHGFLVSFVSGNGFSFDSFTIQTVPEPGNLAMLIIGFGGLGFTRRMLKA